jgi:hypothetical protein
MSYPKDSNVTQGIPVQGEEIELEKTLRTVRILAIVQAVIGGITLISLIGSLLGYWACLKKKADYIKIYAVFNWVCGAASSIGFIVCICMMFVYSGEFICTICTE